MSIGFSDLIWCMYIVEAILQTMPNLSFTKESLKLRLATEYCEIDLDSFLLAI